MTPQLFIEQPLAPIRRNPLITRTLYYSKDMENFATGLKEKGKLTLQKMKIYQNLPR